MTTETLITSRDPKGRQCFSVLEAVYDKAELNPEEAQHINEQGYELKREFQKLIARLRVRQDYANEQVISSYTYPNEYAGPQPIAEQVDILAELFGLSLGATVEYIEKVLPSLELPKGAEGWFAIPSVGALAARHFPKVTDPAEQYCRAVELVLKKISHSRKFYNYRQGQINPNQLRQYASSMAMMEQTVKNQPGDIMIIPAQFGLRHRGCSVRRARAIFTKNEFGLGALAVGSMLLTHPKRLVRWEQLHVDCTGDEFAPVAGGQFVHAPFFDWLGGGVGFYSGRLDNARVYYGSASGFLPQ